MLVEEDEEDEDFLQKIEGIKLGSEYNVGVDDLD